MSPKTVVAAGDSSDGRRHPDTLQVLYEFDGLLQYRAQSQHLRPNGDFGSARFGSWHLVAGYQGTCLRSRRLPHTPQTERHEEPDHPERR
jgi:hypothetical protein